MKRAPSDMSQAEVEAWLHEYPGITFQEALVLDLPPHEYEQGGQRFWLERTFMTWVGFWVAGEHFRVAHRASYLAMRGAALSSTHAAKKP